MFPRVMTCEKMNIDTISEVNYLENCCKRYIELDQIIFGGIDPIVHRDYTFRPYIQPDSFALSLMISIYESAGYNSYIELDYSRPFTKDIKITVKTLSNVSNDILNEFCNLHEELFGVPVTIGYSGWGEEHTYLSFNSLNKDDSQN